MLNYLGYSLIDKGKNLSEALEMVKRRSSFVPMTAISSTASAGLITSSAITKNR